MIAANCVLRGRQVAIPSSFYGQCRYMKYRRKAKQHVTWADVNIFREQREAAMNEEIVKDKVGHILYRVQKIGNEIVVKNKVGKTLGYCRNGKTYNRLGGIVAHSEQPGLLYDED